MDPTVTWLDCTIEWQLHPLWCKKELFKKKTDHFKASDWSIAVNLVSLLVVAEAPKALAVQSEILQLKAVEYFTTSIITLFMVCWNHIYYLTLLLLAFRIAPDRYNGLNIITTDNQQHKIAANVMCQFLKLLATQSQNGHRACQWKDFFLE